MYILSTLFQCGGIRIKVDLPFLLKKKWTRAKRDGSLSDPINHAKSSAAVFFHWHVSIWKSLPLGPIQITLESISSSLLFGTGMLTTWQPTTLYPLFFFSVRNSERIIIKMRLLTVSNRKCAFTFCKRIFCIKKFNSVFGNRSMNCYELSRFIIIFRFVSHICY